MRTRTVRELKCKRCGYLWIPVKIKPKKCPKCQSLKWSIERDEKT